MIKYNYTARDEAGKSVKGEMLAESELELGSKVAKMGQYLTGYKVSKGPMRTKGPSKRFHLKTTDILRFTFQLATLIDAGLPLLDGLKDMARESGDERAQTIIDDIRYRVEAGETMEGALSFHPNSFPQLYRAIIGAGEATGKLGQVLHDLTILLEWQMELDSKVKEAATYPIILSLVLVGVVTILVVKVIPMFEPIFEELHATLPLPTQIVLGVSYIVRHYWYVFPAVIGSVIFGWKSFVSTAAGRYKADSLILKVPLFGSLTRKIALSRFVHTFALSFRAGINLLTCLDIAKKTTGNVRLERAISNARDSVNVGEKLAGSLQVSGEFPPMVIRMIAVGEQTGSLTTSLLKIAEYYDKDVASSVRKIFTAFEPIMIVTMGAVVGGIAMSIFMPMFQMVEKMG
jgi:type IV pilus assembly protein PilC